MTDSYDTPPTGSAPRYRRIDSGIARAYRAKGWLVSESGRAYPPASSIRSGPRPPGFSKLPAPTPTRSTNMSRSRKPNLPSAVPPRVASLTDVPRRLWPLYESDYQGFVRNAAGDALAEYRNKRLSDPLAEPSTKRRTMSKQLWMTLVGVADPGREREHFLRDVATKRIQVEG